MKLSYKNILLYVSTGLSLSVFCMAKEGGVKEPAVVPAPAAKGEKPAVTKEADAVKEVEKVEKVEKVKKVKPGFEPQVYGWKEWVWIVNPEVVLRAKLDTGATTCSIHATNIEKIEIDGKKWVKFTISDPASKKGPRLKHKAPYVRISKVKNDQGGLDERYVVPMTFQIGDRKLVAEFNLNNRSEMTCAMLLGRNVLEKIGYVDSNHTYILKKPVSPKAKKSSSKKSK